MILAYGRTIILYLTLFGAVRLMGKRQVGQLEPSEFVVAMLLADLAARTLLRPVELNIGVVTSLVGAVAFILIFYRTRKAG